LPPLLWLLTHTQARVHLLIVARDVSGELLLSNGHLCMRARPLILTAYFRPVTHLPLATASLLVHMHRVALAFVHRLRRSLQPAAVAFQAGFHSVPSLVPLHMHVMSRDFDRYTNGLCCWYSISPLYRNVFTPFACSPSLKKKLVRRRMLI
jgi:hypothetical protein